MASSAGETFDGHAVHLEVTPMIQSARRIENYHYAIRHLASAAETLTRAGREVIYLSIGEAREAVAGYATRLGAPTRPDQVLITSGASEAADILLTALLNESDQVLLPAPGYPIYPAILSKLGAATRYYHLDPANGWQPSLDEITSLINNKTRALVLIKLSRFV